MATNNGNSGRNIDYATQVRKAWGKQYKQPDDAYKFSNGRTFKDTTQRGGSFYVPTSTSS